MLQLLRQYAEENGYDHIVVGANVYGGTFRLFDKVFRRQGIDFDFVDHLLVVDAGSADGNGPRPYAAGSWGPAAASALVARDGFSWAEEQ